MQENARAEREGDRAAETKRERNANKGVFKEMKGAETAVKWKEVKGHARKLSGKTCKGSEVQIIPKTNRTWRIKEREGVPGGRLCRVGV